MRARLLLLAAALAAFGASLGSGFHFDDYAIFSDAALTSKSGWLAVWGLRQTRPLTYFTYWLNYSISGRDPFGYHLLNLLFHLGAVLLAYECLRRILPHPAAWLAAAIFATHPLQAESVDYIWGRPIVLAALFCFAALLCWLRSNPWWAVLCFALALASKEECAAFPLVLLLLPLPRTRRGLWAVASMLALSLASGVRVAYLASITPGAQAGAQAAVSPWHYLLAQAIAIPRYFRLLIVPWGFSIDPEIAIPPAWLGVAVWIALLAAAVLLWWRTKWGGWFAAGLLLLLPSSSIFPANDLAADRRMYLPLFAFAALLALALVSSRQVRQIAGPVAVSALVLAVLVPLAFWRTRVWSSDETLWREALAAAPGKVRPRIQLARDVPAPEALHLLAEARRLAPGDPAIAAETGRVLMEAGNPGAALGEFGRALALDPRDANNYNNRGVALAALGQFDAARMDFRRALDLSPGLTSAQENLRKTEGR
jgi:tetratricopeptide (TPR) repeat protein